MKRLLLLLLALLALILAACGEATATNSPTPTATKSLPTPTPTPIPHATIGQTIRVGFWDTTVTNPRTVSGEYDYGVPDKPTDTFLVLSLQVINKSGALQKYTTSNYFELQDDDGNKFTGIIISGPGVTDDPSGPVEAEKKLKGDIKFEVPKSLKKFTLVYDVPRVQNPDDKSVYDRQDYFWDVALK